MPLFEYLCPDCSHRFETLVRAENPAPRCPSCESPHVQKQLSVFAVGSAASTGLDRRSVGEAGTCGTCGDPRGPGACSLN